MLRNLSAALVAFFFAIAAASPAAAANLDDLFPIALSVELPGFEPAFDGAVLPLPGLQSLASPPVTRALPDVLDGVNGAWYEGEGGMMYVIVAIVLVGGAIGMMIDFAESRRD